jgi:hypothetical protein
MNADWMMRAIWGAGCVHVGIMAANVPLPGRLRVQERLAGVPRFVCGRFSMCTGCTS